jgi:hypothetical protein
MKPIARSVCAVLGMSAALVVAASAETSGETRYRVSGPFTYKNLAVYLIHGPDQLGANRPTGKLLTFEEALERTKVVVYETGKVNELAIENVSGEDVFIQSGEIVKGGQQDRTFKDDLVLPGRSGRVPIASFCVERGRWSRRGAEPAATFASDGQMVATKDLKVAVRAHADQGEVWRKVAETQQKLGAAAQPAGGTTTTTSLNLSMTLATVRGSSEGYIRILAPMLDKNDDAVGYAYAINGKLEGADVYASHELFARLWRKLLKAGAVEALAEAQGDKKFEWPSKEAVRSLFGEAEAAGGATQRLNPRTLVSRKESGAALLFETRDPEQRAGWLHRSYLMK